MSKKEDNRLSFAEFVFQKVCPDNRFLDEMNEIIPWGVKCTEKSRQQI